MKRVDIKILLKAITRNFKAMTIVEIGVLCVIFSAVISLSVPLYNRYQAKVVQRHSIIEAKEFIDAYRKALKVGIDSFKVADKDYSISAGTIFEGSKFKGSDSKTDCSIKLTTRVEGERPEIIVSDPQSTCFDLVIADKTVSTFKKYVLLKPN